MSKYLSRTARHVSEEERIVYTPKMTVLNDTVDWRTQGYVTEIKDQVMSRIYGLMSLVHTINDTCETVNIKLVSS